VSLVPTPNGPGASAPIKTTIGPVPMTVTRWMPFGDQQGLEGEAEITRCAGRVGVHYEQMPGAGQRAAEGDKAPSRLIAGLGSLGPMVSARRLRFPPYLRIQSERRPMLTHRPDRYENRRTDKF
jgi:hypothetical protein